MRYAIVQTLLFIASFAVFGLHYQVVAEDGYAYDPSYFQYQSSGTSTGGAGAPYASSGSSAAGSDFTSKLVNKFQTIAKGWEKTFHAIAIRIFWILAAIALFIKFAPIVLGGSSDFGTFARELVMFVLTTTVVFYLVQKGPELFIDLFNFFTEAGKQAAGTDGGPQEVLSATLELVKGILKSLSSGFKEFGENIKAARAQTGITKIGMVVASCISLLGLFIIKIIFGIMGLTCCLIAAVLAAIVAIKYAVVLTSAYVIAYAGIIILGFSGWGFTRDVIASYFKTAAGIGIQLMCYVLLMGTGRGLILLEAQKLTTEKEGIIQVGEYFTFLICMVMWYELIKLVPPMVAGIAGAPTMREPSVKSMGGMAALAAAPLALPAAGAAGGAAGAAATKAAAAAAGTTATKGQIFAGALKGAMGNIKEAGTRAVKQATASDGGSFGAVMKSALGVENTGPSSPKAVQEQQKQAHEKQEQAKRDETQAQIAQALAGQGGGQGNQAGQNQQQVTATAHATADANAKAEADSNGQKNGGGGPVSGSVSGAPATIGANNGIRVNTNAQGPDDGSGGAPDGGSGDYSAPQTSAAPRSVAAPMAKPMSSGPQKSRAADAAKNTVYGPDDVIGTNNEMMDNPSDRPQ